MKHFRVPFLAFGLALTAGLISGCNGGGTPPEPSDPKTGTTSGSSGGDPKGGPLTGNIVIDGSSTVYKASAAVAESFMDVHDGMDVRVSSSGTGAGMKKLAAGEIDIAGASRPIKKDELEACTKNGIEIIEIAVGYDGLTVVVNPKNTWTNDLTVAELKKMWEPNSTVRTWKDVRPSFPDTPITFYGPGTASGTFDFFTKVIMGEEDAMRTDFQASEDDNVILNGVAGDEGGIGYFGMAYWEENKDKVKAIGIDSGDGPVLPGQETVANLSYKPLSRPEFIYVNKSALSKPGMKEFVAYYLSEEGQANIKEVGYVPFVPELYERIKKRFDAGVVGSLFMGIDGKSVDAVMTEAGY